MPGLDFSGGGIAVDEAPDFSAGGTAIEDRPDFSRGGTAVEEAPDFSRGGTAVETGPDFSQHGRPVQTAPGDFTIPENADPYDRPARSSEELAARGERSRAALGLGPGTETTSPWQFLTTPLVNLAHSLKPQELSDAWDVLKNLPVPSEGPSEADPDLQVETINDLQRRAPTTTEKVVAGTQQAVADSVNFFTSPLGIATLGTAKLPVIAQKAIAGAFVADMARHVPGQVEELAQAVKDKDPERLAKAATGLGLSAAFITAGAKSVLERTRVGTPEPEATPAEPTPSPQERGQGEGDAPAPAPAVQTPAPEPAPTTTVLADHPVREVPLADLRLSRDVPNFKADADAETGVVSGQELSGRYQRLGTGPIVVWERNDGAKEVITGRHRFDLAKRSGEKTIPAQIVREADGFTKDMALTFDAEANIRDGQGSVEDYATYFKGTHIAEGEARTRGLLDRAKGQAGWSLAKSASDDLYSLWRAGKVDEDKAVAIARAAPGNPDLQALGSAQALKGKSIPEIQNFLKAVAVETGGRAAQLDMFGRSDAALQEAERMASAAAAQQKDLSEQIRAVQSAAKRPEIAARMGVDVKDPGAVLARIAELKAQLTRWENWPLHPDLTAIVKGEPAVRAPVLELAKPESVEEQTGRLAQEAAAAKAAADRQRLQDQAAAPIVGRSVDTTGDMFDPSAAEAPLFTQPVTHSMAAGTAAHSPGAAPMPAPRLPVPRPPPAPRPVPVDLIGRLGAALTNVRRSFQSVFSPQNMDPQARIFSLILREHNAQSALDLVRSDEALKEFRDHFDKTPVPADWSFDPADPLPRNFQVMDDLERRRGALPPDLQRFGDAFDKEFAWRIAEVRRLNPEALQHLIANYFPHLWEKPESGAARAFMAEVAARSPFHGNKGFLKQRSIPFFADGLARGLKPVSDNPVDLLLAKMHQMDKFIMAERTLQESEASGMRKYLPLGRKLPDGWTIVDDPAFTVHTPPVLPVREAFDAGLRKGLVDFMAKMGFSHERVTGLGINRWGQYTTGGEIKSRFGGPDGVIMHEIGHGLEERYGISRQLTATPELQGELKALAQLRAKGTKTTPSFQKYIQSVDEQMANAVHAYLWAPDVMERVAPAVKRELAAVIQAHPELHDLNEIRPSLALDTSTTDFRLAGPVLAGHWIMPEGPAQVLRNFLSPGLQRFMLFRTMRAASNLLNAAQLGLSGFHVGFTSLDSVISTVATGMQYALRGQTGRGLFTIAASPLAPLANYYTGKAVQAKMVNPSARGVRVLDFPRLGIPGLQKDFGPPGEAQLDAVAQLAVKGGLRATVDPFWKTEVTRNLKRAFYEGGVKGYAKTVLAAPLALVEQSMRPISEFLVPRQKLGVFAKMASERMDALGAGADVNQVRDAMARAANDTEDRMGQMTYDNLFYNRALKDVSLLMFRAYGWQLGKYRQMVGSAGDWAKLAYGVGEKTVAAAAGKPSSTPPLQMTSRMLYPLGLVGVAAAVGSLINYMNTGEAPKDWKDLIFPRTGKLDAHGNPQRVALPTYLKDVVSDWSDFPNLRRMGPSFYHKLNPWISQTIDMLRNRDFYDTEIRHVDDPFYKQAADTFAFAARNAIPFSIVGTMKLRDENAPAAQVAMPFLGIVPAKRSLTMTAAETRAAEITQDAMPAGTRTRAQADHSEALRILVRGMREAPLGGRDELRQAVQNGTVNVFQAQEILQRTHQTPLQYQVSRMPMTSAMQVWDLASPPERETLRATLLLKLAEARTLTRDQAQAYRTALGR